MILNYVLSALSKPEVASSGVELFLRLLFSPEVRKHCMAGITFARNNAARFRLWSIIALTSVAVVADSSKKRTLVLRPRGKAPVSGTRRRNNAAKVARKGNKVLC